MFDKGRVVDALLTKPQRAAHPPMLASKTASTITVTRTPVESPRFFCGVTGAAGGGVWV